MRVRRIVRRERYSACLREVLAGELEEALDRRLLATELLGELARVLGGERQEVLEAALRIVRQRIDARDVLLADGDPHRRPALGQRARAADGGHDDLLLRRDERRRQQALRGQAGGAPGPGGGGGGVG